MNRRTFLGSVLLSLFAFAATTLAQPQQTPRALTLELAEEVINAAQAFAEENEFLNITIVVLATDGAPVYVRRLGTASPGTFNAATNKARVVIGSGLTSFEYLEQLEADEIDEVEVDGPVFGGGVPIVYNGELIGAIAVSGLPPADDEQVAQAGADAIGDAPEGDAEEDDSEEQDSENE